MGKKVVGVTSMLAALGLCSACTEMMTVGMGVVEETVEEELRVGTVTRGGSEERS